MPESVHFVALFLHSPQAEPLHDVVLQSVVTAHAPDLQVETLPILLEFVHLTLLFTQDPQAVFVLLHE